METAGTLQPKGVTSPFWPTFAAFGAAVVAEVVLRVVPGGQAILDGKLIKGVRVWVLAWLRNAMWV